MRRRSVAWVIACGLFVGLLQSPATARAQVIVVTARSAGELIDDLHYLIEAGMPLPDAGATLKALDQLKDPRTGSGLDLTRPLGVFADVTPVPSLTIFAPVASKDVFLNALRSSQCTVEPTPEGVAGFTHRVSFPNKQGPDLYLLTTKDYGFLCNVPAGAERLQSLKPADLLPKRKGAGLLSGSVRFDRVPAEMKQAMLAQAKIGAEAELKRRPGENDDQFRGRQAGSKAALEAMTSLFNEGREFSIDIDVDPKSGEMSCDFRVEPLPGTPMAASLKAFGGRRSLFRSLAKSSALAVWANVPLGSEIAKLFTQGFEHGFAEGAQRGSTPAQKELAKQLSDALHPTLTADEADLGMAWFAPTADTGPASKSVVLVGMKVKDGRKLEQALTDGLKNPDRKGEVNLNFAKTSDGKTAIHRVQGAKDEDDEFFGKPQVYIAVRDDVFMASLGENGLAVLKQELDRARPERAAGEAPSPPVELALAMKRTAKLKPPPPLGDVFPKAFAESFTGRNADKDQFHFEIASLGGALQVHLVCDVPVLGFFSRMGLAQNAQQAAGKP